jgi:hypothetical protein
VGAPRIVPGSGRLGDRANGTVVAGRASPPNIIDRAPHGQLHIADIGASPRPGHRTIAETEWISGTHRPADDEAVDLLTDPPADDRTSAEDDAATQERRDLIMAMIAERLLGWP